MDREKAGMGDTAGEIPVEVAREPRKHSLLVDLSIRLVREKPLGTFGAVIVLVMLFAGIFADFLAPYGMYDINPYDRLSAPSAQYILGTDSVGRDLFSRIIFGARISLIVGLAASAINVLVALAIGLPSGFLGGKFDLIMQRIVDAFMCFPWLFFTLTVMAIMGAGLLNVIIVLGVLYGIWSSRVIRSAVMGIKENTYVEAAKATGATTARILIRNILPNIMAPIIILFSISVGGMILAEASMSFLGFGIPPPEPSWGGMLSGPGRQFMLRAPWLAIWPGLALTLSVFGINMLGDAVRDILDPRLRGRLGRYGEVKVKEAGTRSRLRPKRG